MWIGTSRCFEQSLLRRTGRGQAIQPKLLFFLEGFPIFASSLENLTDAPLGEGQFRYASKRWEVSGALRGQLVGLQVDWPEIAKRLAESKRKRKRKQYILK